jgi:hypothetical protein
MLDVHFEKNFCDLVQFKPIWYVLFIFGVFFTLLVFYKKKHLATMRDRSAWKKVRKSCLHDYAINIAGYTAKILHDQMCI